MQSEIPAHRVGSDVFELDPAQSQTVCVNQKWVERCTGESSLQCCIPNRTCGRASVIDVGINIVRREERKVELEGIILAQVRRKTSVLEAVVEKSKTTPSYELRGHLVSETNPRRKIRFLRSAQTLAILIRHS